MDPCCQRYQDYVAILKEELIPAMGCTEPIAIAYAAAKAGTPITTPPPPRPAAPPQPAKQPPAKQPQPEPAEKLTFDKLFEQGGN